MKHKKIKSIDYILLSVIIFVLLYFTLPPMINKLAGFYYSTSYSKRLSEKAAVQSTTYYISSIGDDNNDGRSIATAWRTIYKINKTELNPGDAVLFEGNQTFSGNLFFDEYDLGTSKKPILISSYGSGKAIINALDNYGIKILNTHGFHISKIILKGSGQGVNQSSGIAVINDLRGNIKLDFIQIDYVESSGFGFWGIVIDGNRQKSGFKNVTIKSCNVYNNGDAGIYVSGEYNHLINTYAHENVRIIDVKAYNNLGRQHSLINTGSGIVLSDTDTGLIEKCIAYNNGVLCYSKQGGPVGIWAWDSRAVVIQYNESFNNKTGGTKDGGGFDLDGGMVNSAMQYNYSHDNEGAGFFLAQFSYARKHTGNIVRYNISYNDGRKNNYAGIEIWGKCDNAFIYNNTVYSSTAYKSNPSALIIRPNDELGENNKKIPENLVIANNIFISSGKIILVQGIDPSPTLKLINNNYFNLNQQSTFTWSGKEYSNIKDWHLNAFGDANLSLTVGFSVNPKIALFENTGFIMAMKKDVSIASFQLMPNSPMIDAGINVSKDFKLKFNAYSDITNMSLPQLSGFDIGACEFKKMEGL